MTYDTYRIIFYAGIALAVFCFLLAIALFFLLNIPAVIGDLSGSTEKKAIELIRNRNVNESQSSRYELGQSQKLSGESRKLGRNRDNTMGMGFAINTAKFSTKTLEQEAKESYETTVLDQSNETTVLNETSYGNETTVLSDAQAYGFTPAQTETQAYGETSVLAENPMGNAPAYGQTAPADNGNNGFSVEYEITLVHTDEVIT